MTLYCHGASARLARHFGSTPPFKRLRLWHLPRLGPDDVILTARPWSPVLERMIFSSSRRRPWIVQLADGIAFPLNTQKQRNRRLGGLQRHVFADCYFALQNLSDFDIVTEDSELVRSGTRISVAPELCKLDPKSAIIVAGNDPYFDFTQAQVQAAFGRVADRLRQLGFDRVFLSCPNRKLRRSTVRVHPWLRIVDRIQNCGLDLAKTLMVGSPSTVLFDHLRRGGTALLMALYADPVLQRYFSTDTALDAARKDPEGQIELTALMPREVQQHPLDLVQLLAQLTRRDSTTLPPRQFWRNLNLRMELRDLMLLTIARHDVKSPQ